MSLCSCPSSLMPVRHIRKLMERKRENQQVSWGHLGMVLWMTPLRKDLLQIKSEVSVLFIFFFLLPFYELKL